MPEVYKHVVKIDEDPCPILLDKSTMPLDCTNGRALVFPEGIMIVVGHENFEIWPDITYERYIRVVSQNSYHPILEPEDGDDAVIGYYLSKNGIRHDVVRKRHMDGDFILDNIEKGACKNGS